MSEQHNSHPRLVPRTEQHDRRAELSAARAELDRMTDRLAEHYAGGQSPARRAAEVQAEREAEREAEERSYAWPSLVAAREDPGDGPEPAAEDPALAALGEWQAMAQAARWGVHAHVYAELVVALALHNGTADAAALAYACAEAQQVADTAAAGYQGLPDPVEDDDPGDAERDD